MMRDPHQHRSVKEWILLFESVDDAASLLVSCPSARAAWAEGIVTWLEHVSDCPACRLVADAQEAFTDDCLGCPECLSNLELVYRIVDEAEHFEPAVVLELERAERNLEELGSLAFADALREIRTDHAYQQWGMAQRLLFAAREAWHRDPELALHRALLAVAVAQELDPDAYVAEWLADLEAKAHAYVANAHRILGRLGEAEAAFRLAEQCLRRGVGSGQAEARVLSLKVSLLNDQQRHAEALALIEHVARFREEHGESHELARLTLLRARVLQSIGQPAKAAQACARAVEILGSAPDPHLLLIARKNAIQYLVTAGETERARALFDQLPPMPEPLDELRRRWVEADLLRAERRHADARAAYERVRTGFAEAGLHYDSALAALDLARTAYAEGGRLGEVRTLANDAAIQLTLAGAHSEAYAAQGLLLKAIRDDALTHALLVRVRRQIETLRPS